MPVFLELTPNFQKKPLKLDISPDDGRSKIDLTKLKQLDHKIEVVVAIVD